MHLHEDWLHILRHAWSIRFIGIAALLSALEVGLPMIQPYLSINPIWLSLGAGLATAAAFISRLIAQKEFDSSGPE